jgi:hypothetical protein
MVAGSLAAAGYYMGDGLYPPRGSNPKGFFEGPQINGINESLLAPAVPTEQGLKYGQRWLAELAAGSRLVPTQEVDSAIRSMVEREPYCFKDPRFSYTLPVWALYLRNTKCICVFRDPGATAVSIVRECADAAYLSNVRMTYSRALSIWTSIYKSVISLQVLPVDWIFLHYYQIVNGEGLEKIARGLDAPVDNTFPDASLNRSRSDCSVPREALSIYGELCRLADYSPECNQQQN